MLLMHTLLYWEVNFLQFTVFLRLLKVRFEHMKVNQQLKAISIFFSSTKTLCFTKSNLFVVVVAEHCRESHKLISLLVFANPLFLYVVLFGLRKINMTIRKERNFVSLCKTFHVSLLIINFEHLYFWHIQTKIKLRI